MKVISIYELLGLIKQGKQPSKIKYFGSIYKWEEDWYYTEKKNYKVFFGGNVEDGNQLFNAFNENVEITEEDKEIEYKPIQELKNRRFTRNQKQIAGKINELIKAVNELKKGK